MRRFTSALVLGFLFSISFLAKAQNPATITGVVTDTSGAVVQGVHILLSNPTTGVQYTAETNSEGAYRISPITPGPGYEITFTQAGFAPFHVDNLYINVANVRTQNAQLKPGQSNVEITVDAAGQGVTLNTEDASIGNNLEVSKLNDLPVQSRSSPAVLFTLQPGITLSGATTGARTDQTNATLDGLDVNDFGTGNFQSIVANAPVDSVQEFRGTVGGFTSSSGPGGGGQFQMVTKSGTNHWHGDVNEYHRDNSMVANDWFNNLAGVRAAKLVRNQFGGALGGPIKHERAFFFFDYYNSRIAQSGSATRTVPLPSLVQGNVGYINNGPNCLASSRQNTTPTCISFYSPTQVQQLDPAGIGESPAVMALLKQYPTPNNLSSGDGINTGGYRFNSPSPDNGTNYVGRVDYNLTNTIHLWGRGTVARENSVNSIAQFPGQPAQGQFVDRSTAYVAGMDWQISNNKINQFLYGSNVQDWSFPRPQNPWGIDQVSLGGGFDSFYASPSNAQARRIPIPQITDNFTWDLGRHSLTMGGTFKWITQTSSTTLAYNTYNIGLNFTVQNLVSTLRPKDIRPNSSTAATTWDNAFTDILGRVGGISGTFNYNAEGQAQNQGLPQVLKYRYYQPQVYVNDTWRISPQLTLNYGLDYQYFSVPYETHGLETVQTMPFDAYMNARVTQSAAGAYGNNAVPYLSYVLGGPVNHGPGLYGSDFKNFGPHVGFAWNPKFDQATVFRGSFGVVYDRTIISAVQYQQTQFSYLFQQPLSEQFGNGDDPVGSLKNDARYDAPPAVIPPTTPKAPFTPYVDADGVASGLTSGAAFNEMIDPKLKTPYSMMVSFGMQHAFSNSTLLKIDYVGRFGRRLLAQADSEQLIEFPDKASGQVMSDAVGNLTKGLRAGLDPVNHPENIPVQPWFENQLPAGYGQSQGFPNNTAWVAYDQGAALTRGDFADTIQGISSLLQPNVGMASQFSENTFYTNKGFSTYHGLLVTLQKNLSHGLQFTANYTWSHSIDNVSVIANYVAFGGYGFICDSLHPRSCRGNSDFDTAHYFNSTFNYALPVGRGRPFGGNLPRAVDELLGGWDVSGIPSWHSGPTFTPVGSAFVAGYANNAPVLFNGDTGAIARDVHKVNGTMNLFKDQNAALGAFQGPIGFHIGSRNILRGPQYFNIDAGLAKTFQVVPEWGLLLKLRGDAFNVLNHPNFTTPTNTGGNNDITSSTFGNLTSMNGNPRILQVSLRMEF